MGTDAESWASTPARRNVMVANKGRDTGPELAIRRLLHAHGLRYRVNARVLADARRTVDVAFGPSKVAVFVDGCFWHCCPEHATYPATNVDYWLPKLRRNVERDQETTRMLEAEGWIVLRFWEHESPENATRVIERTVRARRST